MDLTHANLCALAVKWLKRPHSACGHGCQVAVSECKSGHDGEIPDAIGFRNGYMEGSVMVEVKVSRGDFLADKAKPHRKAGAGMGTWRYYMAPQGLINAAELPERWGLLEVTRAGHVKPIAGPVSKCKGHPYPAFTEACEAFRHEGDMARERSLLVMLLARLSDPEALNRRIREANNATAHLIAQLGRERKRNDELQQRLFARELASHQATPKQPPEQPA